MIRDIASTDLFRGVAKKAFGEHATDGPNAATYLDQLASQIIDSNVTTGDELIDALVAWYGHGLERETIDRFHRLDTEIAHYDGEDALVVSRQRTTRIPYRVEAAYSFGTIAGDGLECELMTGTARIPAESHISVGRGRLAHSRMGGLVVTRIYSCGLDDEYRFLGYGTPNLAKQYSVDGRVKSAFNPHEYATADDAIEARKCHTQVILGTTAVREYLDQNPVAARDLEIARVSL